MQTLKEWRERCLDQSRCWMVMRLEKCKIVWLALDGSIITQGSGGLNHWTRVQENALCWTDRESAYQQARQSGGLLYQFDR